VLVKLLKIIERHPLQRMALVRNVVALPDDHKFARVVYDGERFVDHTIDLESQ
jgi:hypothetical protein